MYQAILSKLWNQNILYVAVGGTFFLCQVLFQVLGGAFENDFGGHPDEAAHYITGLMVRDYVASGDWSSPLQFAQNYYLHYPKVAFGHWPPFFYTVQAAWTLVLPPSRLTMCLLQALLATLLSFCVFKVTQEELGFRIGLLTGLMLMFLPIVQQYSTLVMAEILVALLSFGAAMYFSWFLKSESWKDALGFSICSVLAILTKGNGIALGLLPLVSLILLRNLHYLRLFHFWCSGAFVVTICGPVYWFSMDMVRNTWQHSMGIEFVASAVKYYSWQLIELPGLVFFIVISIGVWVQVIKPWKEKAVKPLWATMGALIMSVWLFHILVPSSLEARNMMAAVPALMLFFAAGCQWVIECNMGWRIKKYQRTAVVAIVTSGIVVGGTFAHSSPRLIGFSEVAQKILETTTFENSVILVSSDTRGEGAFISSVAQGEKRPGHIVLRSSKVLARSTWTNRQYHQLYESDNELMEYLEGLPVGLVILDTSIPIREQDAHHRQLTRVLENSDESWTLLGSYLLDRDGSVYPDAIRVYLQKGHENRPIGTIIIGMDAMLGHSISNSTPEPSLP